MENTKTNRKKVNFRLPLSTIDAIKAMADAWHISQADIIVLAMADFTQRSQETWRPTLRIDTTLRRKP